MRRQVAAVVAVSAVVCWLAGGGSPRAADAEADPEDALIHRGIELRRQGNERAALDQLERAYTVRRSPRAAAQLGFVEQALGMWPQAEEHVREALAANGDPWMRKNHATVEAALATIRGHIGHVQIDGGVPGAQVTVNGRPIGLLPLADPVPVSAGPVDVELRASGYAPALKTVNVAAGELMRVPFTLQQIARAPLPPAQPPPFRPGSPAPPSAAGGSLSAGSAPPLLIERTDPGRRKRMTGIGLVAGGVVAIGGGVVASVAAKNKFDAIGADAAAGRPYNESNGNWKGYETGAGVLYVVGGAAIVGGVVLYVAGRPRTEERRAPAVASVALRPVVTARNAGATVSVRF
jgi:hypothetical protein